MRRIEDIKKEPPPAVDGEQVYVNLDNGWIVIYTAKEGKWVDPYECYPARQC